MAAQLRHLLLLTSLAASPWLLRCGGTVTVLEGGGGTGPIHDAGSDASDAPYDAPYDAGNPLANYDATPCPEAGPHLTQFACNPLEPGDSGCPGTEGCYIYSENPSGGSGCGQEVYGSTCATAGSGGEGDSCGGAQDCQSGFSCVVSGEGTQCVQLCPLSGDDTCTGGRVCNPIDVEGFGGCL